MSLSGEPVVFFGSGAFGVPTLDRLHSTRGVSLVITQPDRPAGRRRVQTPTPIGQYAADHHLPVIKPESMNDSGLRAQLEHTTSGTFIVIAYGHKIPQTMIADVFAINLHASLLPKYRGAAPINWAMIEGEKTTGVSVISLADRMDAGLVYAARALNIDPMETAGELHDRLAMLGPQIIDSVLAAREAGTLRGERQDEALATRAPKLSKSDGVLDFTQSAKKLRQRIHGLTPWPGCTVNLGGQSLKLLRVRDVDEPTPDRTPGELIKGRGILTGRGILELVTVQPAGGKAMSFEAYCRGREVPHSILESAP